MVKQWFFERADCARAPGVFGQNSQAQGGITELSCVGPGAGLEDPCGSLPAGDILYELFLKGREGWQRRKGVGANCGEPGKRETSTHRAEAVAKEMPEEHLNPFPLSISKRRVQLCLSFPNNIFFCFYLKMFQCSGVFGGVPGCLDDAFPMSHSIAGTGEPNTLEGARHFGLWAKLVFPRAQHSHTQPHLAL